MMIGTCYWTYIYILDIKSDNLRFGLVWNGWKWLRIRKSNMIYLWQTMTSVHLSVVPCLWRGKLWLINGFGPRVFPTDVQSTIKFTIPTYQQIEGYYKYLQIVPAWCMLNKPHWGGFTCGFWSPGGGPSAESARSDSSGFVALALLTPACPSLWWLLMNMWNHNAWTVAGYEKCQPVKGIQRACALELIQSNVIEFRSL